MRVAVIGGTGHIGTYLVPQLVEAGREVICLSRGRRQPYQPHRAWRSVRQVVVDREAEDAAGTFGQTVAALAPDAVIDLICFTPESARLLVQALRGRVQHFLHCGTIWVHGHSVLLPTTEDQPRRPNEPYGARKAAIEALLLDEARRRGFPAAVLHPGQIAGPGWVPLNPAGHYNPAVFERLAHGDEVLLPNLGMETVHFVHAEDVAQAFLQALSHWWSAVGESFHITTAAALTLRGYAEGVAGWFGQAARLRCLPWPEWRQTVSEAEATATWDLISHSPVCSIEKAQRRLGYRPKHTALQSVYESLAWLVAHGRLRLSRPGARD